LGVLIFYTLLRPTLGAFSFFSFFFSFFFVGRGGLLFFNRSLNILVCAINTARLRRQLHWSLNLLLHGATYSAPQITPQPHNTVAGGGLPGFVCASSSLINHSQDFGSLKK